MQIIYCDTNLIKLHDILLLLEFEFDLYEESKLIAYGYCQHSDHVHVFKAYNRNDLDELKKWEKYCSRCGEYSVFIFQHHVDDNEGGDS